MAKTTSRRTREVPAKKTAKAKKEAPVRRTRRTKGEEAPARKPRATRVHRNDVYTVRLFDVSTQRLRGELIKADAETVIFSHKDPTTGKVVTSVFRPEDVLAKFPTHIWVKRSAMIEEFYAKKIARKDGKIIFLLEDGERAEFKDTADCQIIVDAKDDEPEAEDDDTESEDDTDSEDEDESEAEDEDEDEDEAPRKSKKGKKPAKDEDEDEEDGAEDGGADDEWDF